MMKIGTREIHFWEAPVCPNCERSIPYGKLIARPPRFSVECKCGANIRFRFGKRTAFFWGVTLLVCFLFNVWMLERVSEVFPLLCYTLLIILVAFFLYPLTLHRETEKKKK